MANLTLDKEITALLVIDPYNDFISKGGNFWPRTGMRFKDRAVSRRLSIRFAPTRWFRLRVVSSAELTSEEYG